MTDTAPVPAMLATVATGADLARLSSPAYSMEPKVDGFRMLVVTSPDGPVAYNRSCDRAVLPANLLAALQRLDVLAVLDGEYAQGRYHLFDLVRLGTHIDEQTPWAQRNLTLRRLVDAWGPPPEVIEVVRFVREPAAKLSMLRTIEDTGGEGVVFKDILSPYEPGRRSRHWQKWKRLASVDVVVVDQGTDGRRNLTLALVGDDGDLVEVGRCSALTGDGDRIGIGDVVTVTVTGVGASGRLIEPVTPRLRPAHDKTPAECSIHQLDTIRKVKR